MDVSDVGITEINEAPPLLDLRPEEVEGLADELVAYHAELAFRRVVEVRDGLPSHEVWLVLRRSLGEKPELKTYLCIAPADTPRSELVRIAGMCWPVETALEDGKDDLGMGDYMVRSWLGWHHHMIYLPILAPWHLGDLALLFCSRLLRCAGFRIRREPPGDEVARLQSSAR